MDDENYGRPPSWLQQHSVPYQAASNYYPANNYSGRNLGANMNRSRMNPDAPAFQPRFQQYNPHHYQPLSASAQFNSYEHRATRQNRSHQRRGQSSNMAVGGIEADSDESRRVKLMDAFDTETYECMVCMENVLRSHKIWSCVQCFHSFHLHCVKKWAASCISDEGWRCPGCQNMTNQIPEWYLCFCGKVERPSVRRAEILAHSCGGVCGRSRGEGCPHLCSLYCHPGPCPPCPRTVQISCYCKNEKKHVRCGTGTQYKCSKACDKPLPCSLHKCSVVCHSGCCPPCKESITLNCHCGNTSKEVVCSENICKDFVFSCGQLCAKGLECGEHVCSRPCHPGDCGTCPKAPSVIQRCPCGKSSITKLTSAQRLKCTDPIPLCGKTCDKVLQCGPKDKPHRCSGLCHEGACAPCQGSTPIQCICKSTTKPIPCAQLGNLTDNPVLCTRKCKKNRDCGRHKCNDVCCIDTEHICTQICAKLLECGVHRCTRLCHIGRCPPCLQAGFEELHCECGASVRYPPIPCGGLPPACDRPCSRQHPCQHAVNHKCHNEPLCPPCTVLTKKYCFGKHELRHNIACFEEHVSCGRRCEQSLSCGVHTCIRYCHEAPCETPDAVCKQPCTLRRPCAHPCNQPCHHGQPCPDSKCNTIVKVGCKCGARPLKQVTCWETECLWRKMIATSQVGNELDLQAIENTSEEEKRKCLPCNEDCAKQERNRRLAEALAVRCPDLAAICQPVYTDFLKNMAKSDSSFVVLVEKFFAELILDLEKSKTQLSKSHMFQAMPSSQRQFIHEYAKYFLIETVSYDPEPFRTVHITAKRGRSAIPLVLLSKSMKADNKVNALPAFPKETLTSWAPDQNMQPIKTSAGVARKPPSPPPPDSASAPPPDDWMQLDT